MPNTSEAVLYPDIVFLQLYHVAGGHKWYLTYNNILKTERPPRALKWQESEHKIISSLLFSEILEINIESLIANTNNNNLFDKCEWAATLGSCYVGYGVAEQTAGNMIPALWEKYPGKWDRTHVKGQNGFKSFEQESNKGSQFIYNGVFVFKF